MFFPKKIYKLPTDTWKDAQRHYSPRKMQIKIIMRYHVTPVRTAIIRKTRNNKCWLEFREKETHFHCWWEGTLVQPLQKIVWSFLKILSINIIWSSNVISGYLSEGNEITILKRYLYSHVHSRITYKSQDMETTKVSISG